MTRPRGRPPKYPIEEVRSRLVDVAREALVRDGIGAGLDAVTLDGAIAEAEVPRGSAYRLWRSDHLAPQDSFRRAVTIELLRDIPSNAELPISSRFADEIVEQLFPDDASDSNQMRYAAVEVIRIVAGHGFEQLNGSRIWQVYNALRSSAFTRSESDPELADALSQGESELIGRYSQLFARVAERFDTIVRPPFTWDEFSVAALAINDGLANRATDIYRRRDLPMNTGPAGECRDWTLGAASVMALVEFFLISTPEKTS